MQNSFDYWKFIGLRWFALMIIVGFPTAIIFQHEMNPDWVLLRELLSAVVTSAIFTTLIAILQNQSESAGEELFFLNRSLIVLATHFITFCTWFYALSISFSGMKLGNGMHFGLAVFVALMLTYLADQFERRSKVFAKHHGFYQ